MLKYIAGVITGTALTIIGWNKVITTIIVLVKTIVSEIS